MKVTQESEKVFTVVLNDAELEDLTHEAIHTHLTMLDVMKSVFLMVFMQLCSCRYFRRTLRDIHESRETGENPIGKEHD